MANIEHVNIADPNIHEPKGVAVATASTVYVATGAGTGVWQKITEDELESGLLDIADPFSSKLLHVTDAQDASTGIQTISGGTWNTRRFNTSLTNEITSSSLNTSTGYITLPAGTYYTQSSIVLPRNAGVQVIRLYNQTAATTLITGLRMSTGASGAFLDAVATIQGRFTLAGSSQVTFDNYSQFSNSETISGGPTSQVWASVCIWKIT